MDTRSIALHLDHAHDLCRRLLPGEMPLILRDVTLGSNAVTVIAAGDLDMNKVTRQLAKRLLDTPMRLQSAGLTMLEAAPLLIIGAPREIETFLARHGLVGIPDQLSGRGTSRVWMAHGRNDHPLLVVADDNGQALQDLLRPLPHYGSRSYLVFTDGARSTKGSGRPPAAPSAAG